MHKKPFLPEKICPVCQRPFQWRRKWRLNWEAVRYCSHACQKHACQKRRATAMDAHQAVMNKENRHD